MRVFLRAGCLAAAGLAALGYGGSAVSAADYTRYHTYEEMSAALRDLAKTHAKLAKLVEVAKTREGRTVWAIEIANPAGTPVAERPALMIGANFEGDQLIGSQLALYVAEHLLTGYAGNPDIKQRLDSHVYYIIPRANPDGAEAMFGTVKSFRKTNAAKIDSDNDGRLDEDGPEDLNKDGFISVMRVKDPRGPYMIHPEDPRLLKRADAARGEAGGYAVHWEGIDNDGDGFINEDGPGGVDLNRNFQHQYPYYTADAGPHMVSEPEVRGIVEYVIARRNIAAILTFGESDNLIAAPTATGGHAPASVVDLVAFANASVDGAREIGRFQTPQGFGGRGFGGGGGGGRGRGGAPAAGGRGGPPPTPPATTVAATDLEYFRAVSDKYRQVTGLRATPATRTPGGAFFEYGYYQFGVPSFSTPGWGITAPAGPGGGGPGGAGPGGGGANPSAQGPGGRGAGAGPGGGRAGGPVGAPGGAAGDGGAAFDLRLVRWMDAEKVNGFINWTPFKHPTLGDVEIGGFRPYALSNPDAAKIAELGKGHLDFATYLPSIFPKVAIADTSVTALGGGLYRVKVEVENGGFLPTSSAQGVRSRSVSPTMVQLEINPDDIVSGAPKTSFFPTLAGSGRRQSYEWIIKGKPGSTLTVRAVAQKSGSAAATLSLK